MPTPMDEHPSKSEDLPLGAVHFGTFTIKSAGENVGGVVKLSNDPERDLLETAQSFRVAADRCLTGCKVVPGVEMLTVPGAVCAALACELYLKFIHRKETRKPPRGHDLVELFSSLPESTQDELQATRSDIGQVLERNRSRFSDARYHHELAQFSFRQQELFQLAESLDHWIQTRYETGGDDAAPG